MVAIQDEGSNKMTDAAYDALKRLGAENPLKNNFRSSYALLGYSGPGELDAVTQVIFKQIIALMIVTITIIYHSEGIRGRKEVDNNKC